MRLLDFVREAVSDLRASKLRSLLTGLGVIIGVGSVTLLLSLGEGVRAQVGGTFEDLGTTRLVVGPSGSEVGPSASTITLADAEAIAGVRDVRDAAPSLTLALPFASDLTAGVRMPTVGTVPGYFDITGEELLAGLAFGEGELVIDESAVVTLFGPIPLADAIGRDVEAGGETLRVSGVVADPPFSNGGGFGGGFGGGDGARRTGAVYVPVRWLMDRTDQEYVTQVNLRAVSPETVEDVRLAVRALMEERHGVRDVQVISLARVLDRVNEALSVITGFLAALAGISLLVGGIGIMNIMLAVVAERTREIGIIRALGATRRAVVGQFLTEAIFISLLGGLVGLGLALAGAVAVERFLEVPAIVSPGIVALALGVSTLIGVGFGVLPAYRAARLDPIRALRHD